MICHCLNHIIWKCNAPCSKINIWDDDTHKKKHHYQWNNKIMLPSVFLHHRPKFEFVCHWVAQCPIGNGSANWAVAHFRISRFFNKKPKQCLSWWSVRISKHIQVLRRLIDMFWAVRHFNYAMSCRPPGIQATKQFTWNNKSGVIWCIILNCDQWQYLTPIFNKVNFRQCNFMRAL